MEQNIKIAVIGGTGKSGKYLVKQLVSQGFLLKVLVRDPNNFPISSPLPFVEVVPGNISHYTTVRSLVAGCQAIISTLGLGLPPSPTSIFSQATSHVIRAMRECKVARYIVTTGLNVDTPFDTKGVQTQLATNWMKTNYPETTADKQKEYRLLAASNVDWTLVRLPLIEQTDEQNKIAVSLQDCPGNKISATSLANFLIEQLVDSTYSKKSPFVANV